MNSIRLDARATDVLEGEGPIADEQRRRIFEQVREADRVIDAQDRIIKDGASTNVPRQATFADIEQSRLVQG